MSEPREIYPRPLTQSPLLDGPVLLRDGRPAYLRKAREEDLPRLVALMERSSNASLNFRFFGAAKRNEDLARLLINTTGTGSRRGRFQGVSVVVITGGAGHERIVGVASAVPVTAEEAEVAFLVEDDYQGKGLGTLMLERLSFAAEAEGVHRLSAIVLADNDRMLHVFRDCGYEMVKRQEHGEVQIAFEIVPNETSNQRAELRNKLATQASLRPFFEPGSVAIVGASRDLNSIGGRILRNVIDAGFQGPVYPVNPKAGEIQGLKAYAKVADAPGPIDLAVVAVQPERVAGVVDDCAERGVRAVLVISAGFAETGAEGRDLQNRLLAKVRGHGMRMVGPNCLGLMNTNPGVRLNATFAPQKVTRGRLAMSSQSGALGLAILSSADDFGIGFSSFVSVGNKADVSGNDLLQYWEDDEDTGLILLYLESFGNPRRFARLAPRVARKKPVLAVKSGRTKAGRRAAGSHTAALAASDAGVEALFRQAGVIRTDTLEETFEVAALLAHQPLPRGPRVAILTNAGGLAILCADACEARGLELPELAEATVKRLSKFLPPTASPRNPVDMVASAGPKEYEKAVALLLDDASVDALVVIYIPAGAGTSVEIVEAVRRGREKAETERSKPLLLSILDGGGLSRHQREGEEALPCYRFPESAARALARAVQYSRWLARPRGVIPIQSDLHIEPVRSICEGALRERGEGWLRPDEVEDLLRQAGIRSSATVLCRNADEAVASAEGSGYPVVVKLASTTLVHKSEWDGVRLGLENERQVRSAFNAIHDRLAGAGRAAEMLGVTVQPMMPAATEVMIGMTHDPSFGPLLAFGLGGVTVEVLRDVRFSITPITDQDALEMIRGIRGFPLLDGYRGAPKADLESLVDLLLRVSRIVEEVPVIDELDFNPVRAYGPERRAVVLDARVKVKRSPELPAAGDARIEDGGGKPGTDRPGSAQEPE